MPNSAAKTPSGTIFSRLPPSTARLELAVWPQLQQSWQLQHQRLQFRQPRQARQKAYRQQSRLQLAVGTLNWQRSANFVGQLAQYSLQSRHHTI